jgi:PAS domain S-box-containing protein
MFVRLYSDLPFPWRKEEGGAKTVFENEALRYLRKNPNKPFVKVDKVNGNFALLYAEADILKPSCVDCHNTYPGTPKKDWKVGDVRGVLEIIQPLEKYTAQTRQGLKGTLFMLGSISAIGVAGLTIANRSLQKRSQELASAKNQLEAVLDAVPGSISWISSDGIYLGVNRYLAQDWNLSQEAFIGKDVGFLRGNAQLANFIRRFLGSKDMSASQVIDVEVNDSPRYYLFAAQKYQNGEASVSVGIDITERKKAEESLRLAEEKYRSIFENALEGIFQASLEGKFIQINPAMAQIFGYNSPEEMVDSIRDIDSQIFVDLETPKEFKRRIEEQGEVKGLEYQAYRKDKSVIWVQEDSRAVHDNSGNLLYFEGLLQDITQRKRKEEELNRQLQELRVEIDQQKRKQDVAEITQSDYFQEIQREVKDIDFDEFWS